MELIFDFAKTVEFANLATAVGQAIKGKMDLKTDDMAIVVTNCTGRKLQSSGPVLGLPARHFSSLQDLIRTWRESLCVVERRYPASALYGGRAFREAEKAAKSLGAPLYIASAGVGLAAASDLLPAYDLSVSASGPTVLPALRALGLTPAHWWSALNASLGKPAPIASLLRAHPNAIAYIALPSTYLALIGHELAAMPKLDLARIRIFSSSSWQRDASADLAGVALPYDERLETTEFPGTRSDFPQRALRHFIQALHGNTLSLTEGRAAVEAVMAKHAFKVLPERQKRTDDEIRTLLRLHWQANNGSGDRLLRVLRDDLLVSCEQSRFRTLWKSVQAETEKS